MILVEFASDWESESLCSRLEWAVRCCWFLFTVKVKAKVLVTQSCLTLCDPWTVAARLLCPWDSPGKKTGVGCHSLLQGIFPTQGSKPGLLNYRQTLPTKPPGSLRFLTVKQCYILVTPLSKRTQNKIQSSTNAYKVTCAPCDLRGIVPWPWLGWEVREIAACLWWPDLIPEPGSLLRTMPETHNSRQRSAKASHLGLWCLLPYCLQKVKSHPYLLS